MTDNTIVKSWIEFKDHTEFSVFTFTDGDKALDRFESMKSYTAGYDWLSNPDVNSVVIAYKGVYLYYDKDDPKGVLK